MGWHSRPMLVPQSRRAGKIVVMAEALTKPRRHWLAFSLRTLLVVVTLWGLSLGYVLHWKNGRQAILQRQVYCSWNGWWPNPRPNLWVWLVREDPVGYINVGRGVPEAEFARIAALFPEAEVVRCGNEDDRTDIAIAPVIPLP